MDKNREIGFKALLFLGVIAFEFAPIGLEYEMPLRLKGSKWALHSYGWLAWKGNKSLCSYSILYRRKDGWHGGLRVGDRHWSFG